MVSTSVIAEGSFPLEATVIGASAGGVSGLLELLPGLPASFPPVLVVVHILSSAPSLLPSVFAPVCAMRVCEADPGEPIRRGTIYFAPSDYHLLVGHDRTCELSIEAPVHFSRPAIDVLFESAADVYGPNVCGVVLTGASSDGAIGLERIVEKGGLAFVQDPASAEFRTMPEAAIARVRGATVLPIDRIARALVALAETR